MLYCIDIDAVDTNKDNVKLNKEINEYCSNNGFYLIWFNKTIEHVFLGRLIHQAKNKKTEAKLFIKRQLSSDECCNSKYLLKRVNEAQLQTSNIGFVLGEIIGSKSESGLQNPAIRFCSKNPFDNNWKME